MQTKELAKPGFYVSIVLTLQYRDTGAIISRPVTFRYNDPISSERAERDALDFARMQSKELAGAIRPLGANVVNTWGVRA